MDTSVSDNNWGMRYYLVSRNEYFTESLSEARRTLLPYDAECMGSLVSQYYYLQKS